MAVLVDTNALLSAIDPQDVNHGAVLAYLGGSTENLIVPCTVLPEIDYLVSARFGTRAELGVLRSVAMGEFGLEHFTEADLERALQILEQYSDSNIGFVDASIVAIAERLRITRILTLDRRHFGIFRPRHCPAFDLVP